jgi:ribonuclease E
MKRMLIDASHPEETRVVILDNNKIDDFEAETLGKQQLKGNLYIGHVSRVEPSLQAAFITYGGNRNGFLAFGEVHPQFFALKKDEKKALLEELAQQAARRRGADRHDDEDDTDGDKAAAPDGTAETAVAADAEGQEQAPQTSRGGRKRPERAGGRKERPSRKAKPETEHDGNVAPEAAADGMTEDERLDAEAAAKAAAMADAAEAGVEGNTTESGKGRRGRGNSNGGRGGARRPRRMEARVRPQRAEARVAAPEGEAQGDEPVTEAAETNAETNVETKAEHKAEHKADRKEGRRGGRAAGRDRDDRNADKTEGEGRGNRSNQPIHRRYRIQDVLKEGQKILVQVVKEERGSKGAALTTYFSLPGRYTVLMPNTPYAGGISRKITDPEERRQLRDAYKGLHVPDTMGLIIRTAGLGQDSEHITKDYENLTNLWKAIHEQFEAEEDIQCIHEDGSVIIRALRDMMTDDIDEVIISGARAYKMAKDYAKNLMPDVAKLIKQHKDETPLFTAFNVEQKLNKLHHTRVTLPSGGYLVINPTEALVSVDINSGRATQERNIEETALKTNLEACDELARQIRLRDLAGLIVVDFIDMEDSRNNRKVENAMRKALRRDRARIQTANISEFGLMEISRQRLRPSFGESHFVACPHCLGSGFIASHATAALMLLRRLEEEDAKSADRIIVTTCTDLVMWLLNNKRDLIRALEERAKYKLMFRADDSVTSPDFKLELVSMKADGTEMSQTLDVVLREQPELPPELRPRGYDRAEREERKRVRDEARNEESGDSRRDTKRDDRDDRRDDRKSRRDREDRKDGDVTEGEESSRRSRRPQRAETETAEPAVEIVETDTASPVQDAPKGRRGGRPERAERAESKPAKAEKPVEAPRPAKVVVPAEDKPLAVETVKMEAESSLTAPLPPRKKFEIKKQADTDAADTPLAVANVAADTTSEPVAAKADSKKGSGSLISRLLSGR